MDEEQPLSRRLFRMAVVFLLTTLLLATRGFGAYPDNDLSASLAQMLATNMPAPLTQSLEGYLSLVGAPSLAAVAASHSEADPANSATKIERIGRDKAPVTLSDPQTELQTSESVLPIAKVIATPQPPQPTPAPNTNAVILAAATSPQQLSKAPTALPTSVAATDASGVAQTSQSIQSTQPTPTRVATEVIRLEPSATRKTRTRLPTPSPQVVAVPTPAPPPIPTSVPPPPAPSGQTQTSSATATPDLPERVKATQTTPALATLTTIPEPTLTLIPEIIETAIEPTQTSFVTDVATATPTVLPSDTPSPTETPQPTATEAATATLAPTETQSPATPEATVAPTDPPTPAPERTKKPHPHATFTPESGGG